MAHVEPLTDDQIPSDAQPIASAIKGQMGSLPNIFRTLARVPKLLEGTVNLNQGIHNALPGKFRELAYLKASTTNDCHY